jgi:D-beta-D-heptose 7-phosphate kinase / D-beta-D-heptose 1-phosphate adenosyltransferase
MAAIFVNGCFDLFHAGHRRFLVAAKWLGEQPDLIAPGLMSFPGLHLNRLIVAVNSDHSARKLKATKWGANYPKDSLTERMERLTEYADGVYSFDTERQLHDLIEQCMPCIICKGPDYAGREDEVTGSDIAPVLILDTPETDEIRALKRKAYML